MQGEGRKASGKANDTDDERQHHASHQAEQGSRRREHAGDDEDPGIDRNRIAVADQPRGALDDRHAGDVEFTAQGCAVSQHAAGLQHQSAQA